MENITAAIMVIVKTITDDKGVTHYMLTPHKAVT